MPPQKLKNPINLASERLMADFVRRTEEMRFTDSTPIHVNLIETRSMFLDESRFDVLGYLNDPVGRVTLLFKTKDGSAVAMWDEVNRGEMAFLTVSANSFEDLTSCFVLTGDCEPADLLINPNEGDL
jgi:hypothetical protein